MHNVPFHAQSDTFSQLWPITRQHVADVLELEPGRKVAELEKALVAYTGRRHAIGVNSGTDALVLLLRAAGLRPGDGVVVPAFSFVASASAVVLAGGRPVFADVEPGGYGLSPTSVRAVVTADTRFVLPVHLFHRPADLGGLLDVANRLRLMVVEDCAEAIGMRWAGRHVGAAGVGGALSFSPTTTLGALGDAGAVLTDDPVVAETAATVRHRGLGDQPGLDSRMDDVQAAILLAKLGRLESDVRRRIALARHYSRRLADVPGLTLPVSPRRAGLRGVPCQYVVETDDRAELAAHLASAGIGAEPRHPVPLHLQPCFADTGHRPGDFPHAERAARRTLALPLHPDLTAADADRVCDAIAAFGRVTS
ncbi:DegT/DnrJ/EryC1/StrS family aminotransferase [Saccharothrix violaceirubra]|uniref:dTDP-4-amino-4,6-dideoxygalactose transaminase n=1 Tax=Saccharothrix violaceirubra TaxID=413306 RepID=A0A7W7WWL2_9PSEU|nr:DegT/DnrJ/EryC1/StrS family aminotransferase [Saccharothrix violaceirubra]MBB4966107.1 dTDP-4-amino-4,6-dideoxygalactose transaminase [Saccharothrix violaceirubra]